MGWVRTGGEAVLGTGKRAQKGDIIAQVAEMLTAHAEWGGVRTGWEDKFPICGYPREEGGDSGHMSSGCRVVLYT